MTNQRSIFERVLRRLRRAIRSMRDDQWDRRLGIQTKVAKPPILHANTRNTPNYGTSYMALEELKSRLLLRPDDVFFDVGCGYGRAVCYFSRQGINSCVGIEIDPVIANRAIKNADSLRRPHAPIEIIAGDATVQDYCKGTIFFLYNPFSAAVLEAVLDLIEHQTAGRVVRFVYVNPVHSHVFRSRDSLILPEAALLVPYLGGQMAAEIWQTHQRE